MIMDLDVNTIRKLVTGAQTGNDELRKVVQTAYKVK
jgi:hypothetical protein